MNRLTIFSKKKIFYLFVLLYIIILCTPIGIYFLPSLFYSEDRKNYQEASKENTIQAFENYIKNYPDGKYINQASDNINWKKASKENTIKAFEHYIKNYPNGQYIMEAQIRIELLTLVNNGHIFAMNVDQQRESKNVKVEMIRVFGGKASVIEANRFNIEGEDIEILNLWEPNNQNNLISITFKIINNQNTDLFFASNQIIVSLDGKAFNAYDQSKVYSSNLISDVPSKSSAAITIWFNLGDTELKETNYMSVSIGEGMIQKGNYWYPNTSSFYFKIDLSNKTFETFPTL